MRILYITTIGSTMGFFPSLIRELLDAGHDVDIATNEYANPVPDCFMEWGCKVYPISCSRSPLDKGNLKAIFEIKDIVRQGNYDIVHCHTPIAAACTRLACKSLRKKGLRVIYTAHGFHFYKGAPLKNWLVYYPIEWLCSFWTDVLITINKEDFERAKNRLHAKRVEYVPGVGIDVAKFAPRKSGREKIRDEFHIDDGFVLLSVGELNENKNHTSVIRAISGLPVTYIIVGQGDLYCHLCDVANECGSKVILTGYRNDVADFYDAADAYILPSIREGLNVSLMEAMATGLPCLCGKIRGNTDLIDGEKGGYLFDPTNTGEVKAAIEKAMSYEKKKDMGLYNLNKIRAFDFVEVKDMIFEIYRGV